MIDLCVLGDQMDAEFWDELVLDLREEVHGIGGRATSVREAAPDGSKSANLEIAQLLVQVAAAAVPVILYFLESRRRGRTITLQLKVPNGTASLELRGTASNSPDALKEQLQQLLGQAPISVTQ